MQDVKILDSTPLATSMTFWKKKKKKIKVRKTWMKILGTMRLILFSLTVPKFLLKH